MIVFVFKSAGSNKNEILKNKYQKPDIRYFLVFPSVLVPLFDAFKTVLWPFLILFPLLS